MLQKFWLWFLSFFSPVAVPDSVEEIFRDIQRDYNMALRFGGLRAGGNAHQRRVARRRFQRELCFVLQNRVSY